MSPAKTAAQRQADLKARRLRDGLVQWKRWIHPDDAPALAQYADSLASARAARESTPKPHNTRGST
jgi:hypothetical protein